MKQAENQPDKEQTFHSRSLTNRRTRSSKPPQNRIHRRWGSIVTVLAALVVVFTVYYLVLPGITLEKDQAENMAGIHLSSSLDCPVQIHQHDESCYKEIPVYDQDGEKTGTEKTLVCGQADYVIHQHDENCYDENGTLVCPLPEVEEHHHTDACYQDEVLVCGQQELHTHTEKCYDKDGNLICGLLELKKHEHGEECFKNIEKLNASEDTTYEAATESIDAEDDEIINENEEDQALKPAETNEVDESSKYETGVTSEEENETGEQTPKTSNTKPRTLSASGDNYTVSVSFGPEAAIPEDAKLKVQKINSRKTYYKEKQSEAEELLLQEPLQENKDDSEQKNVSINPDCPSGSQTVGMLENVPSDEFTADEPTKIQAFALYDISFISEGKEIEPSDTVKTRLEFTSDKFENGDQLTVIHYADDGNEIPSVQTVSVEGETVKASFELDSFSSVAVADVTKVRDYDSTDGTEYVIYKAVTESVDGVDITKYYAIGNDGNYHEIELTRSGLSYNYASIDDSLIWIWDTYVERNIWGYPTGRTYTYLKSKAGNYYINPWNSYIPVSAYPSYVDIEKNGNDTSEDEEAEKGKFFIRSFYNQWYYLNGDDTDKKVTAGNDNGDTFYFMKVTEGERTIANPNDPVPGRGIDADGLLTWYDTLNKEPLKDVSKTAEVYDYDNRIYEIDFTAKSGIEDFTSDIDLAFISDVSNSMLFPSSLTPLTEEKKEFKKSTMDAIARQYGYDKVYIVISDLAGTATNYAVYYGPDPYGANDTEKKTSRWRYIDASYYAKQFSKNTAGIKTRTSFILTDQLAVINSTTNSDGTSKDDGYYDVYLPNSDWLEKIKSKDNRVIFEDGSNRLYYLVDAVSSTMDTMKQIAKEKAYDENTNVRIAWETFAKYIWDMHDFQSITDAATGDRNIQNIKDGMRDITTQDGTRYDKALLAAMMGANWKLKADDTTWLTKKNLSSDEIYAKSKKEIDAYFDSTINNVAFKSDIETINWTKSGTKKYAILITDGAPLITSNQTAGDMETLRSYINYLAREFKKKGITLITIGLGMDNVVKGQQILYEISDGDDIYHYFYRVDDVTKLKPTLYDIIQNIMAKATVSGNVTDKIDPVFYPVNLDGTPLEPGYYRVNDDKSFTKMNTVPASSDTTTKYLHLEKDSTGQWSATWYNQDFPDKEGWRGTLFVKTREDYLGGNSINTNSGEATIIPKRYYVEDSTNPAMKKVFL